MKKITLLVFATCMCVAMSAVNWSYTTLDGAGTNKVRSMCIFDDSEALVVGYDSIVYKTYDSGLSWTKIDMAPFYPATAAGIDYFDASSAGDVAMIAVGKEGTDPGMVLKSSNKGENWMPILISSFANDSALDKDPTFDGASSHRFYSVEVIDENIAFSVLNWKDSTNTTRNGIFKTIDGGTTWSICNTPTMTASTLDGDIEFIGNTGYFAASSNSYVFKTTDAGTTWVDHTDDDLYMFIWGLKVLGENEVFILGQNDLFYYNTADMTNPIVTPLNKTFSTDVLALDKNNVVTFHKHDNIWASEDAFLGDTLSTWNKIGDGSATYIRKCDAVFNDSIYGLGDGQLLKAAVKDVFPNYSTKIQEVADVNPATTIISRGNEVTITSQHTISTIAIYSITGQVVYQKNIERASYDVDTRAFPKGIYIVRADKTAKKIMIK